MDDQMLNENIFPRQQVALHDFNRGEEFTGLARRYGSPIYILDRQNFVRNFNGLLAEFTRYYSGIIVGYSYKTNYIPYLCRLARNLGARAEVVSRLELDLALKLGYSPGEIIFNGPIKYIEDVESALENGMILNLDTFRELEAAIDFARRHPSAEFRIGLRLNISLVDAEGTSHHQDGVSVGRFGFTPADLEKVKTLVRQTPNLNVHSLHGHSSSTTRSLWVYETIARTLADTAERHFSGSIEMLNVGGGFFGHPVPEMGLAEVPSYQDYAAAICGELLQNRWVAENRPQLVIEPGMAVVADTMSFITRVFEIKEIGSRRLAVVDGTIFNVKPTLHKRNHPFQLIKSNNGRGRRGRYDVVGATCMEKDCLLQDIECEEIERGDFIKIDNVGAYTIVMTPPFIHPAPPILVRDRGEYQVIRRRQEFADVFSTYTF
jgi:diaminopimelate decarboxylase